MKCYRKIVEKTTRDRVKNRGKLYINQGNLISSKIENKTVKMIWTCDTDVRGLKVKVDKDGGKIRGKKNMSSLRSRKTDMEGIDELARKMGWD